MFEVTDVTFSVYEVTDVTLSVCEVNDVTISVCLVTHVTLSVCEVTHVRTFIRVWDNLCHFILSLKITEEISKTTDIEFHNLKVYWYYSLTYVLPLDLTVQTLSKLSC